MHILITGAGYIGSALDGYLRYEGHTTETVDVLPALGGRLNHVQMDYRNLSESHLARFSAVVHLAGHSSVVQAEADPIGATRNNLTGFLKFIRKLNGMPLLWASSASVLSNASQSNIYDALKKACEAVVPVVYPNSYALRFGTVNGPSPVMRRDLMLNKMVCDAVTNGGIVVQNPAVMRPILGMRDLCTAVTALLRGLDAPGIYNLCSFNEIVGKLADQVAIAVGVPIAETEGVTPYNFAMSASKIYDWRPSETAETIIPALIAETKGVPA